MNEIVALVHSPLTGPLTWAPVSRELRGHGVTTVVPVLEDHGDSGEPYWWQHAMSAARRLEPLPVGQSVVLVAHSGSGPLLPIIASFSPHPVAGYVFADAGLPHPGTSRLEEIEESVPDLGAELEGGGRFPAWNDEILRDIVPNAGMRAALLADLRPRGLDFFTEPFPPLNLEPDAGCAYIRFSEAYAEPAAQAREDGWVHHGFDAGHFHMLVDPRSVAEVLLDVIIRMRRTKSADSTGTC